MKFLLLILIIFVAVLFVVKAAREENTDLDVEWEAFKNQHKKAYVKGEEIIRKIRWKRNLKLIEKHNQEADAGKHTFRMGINKFGDMTNEEFIGRLSCSQVKKSDLIQDDADLYIPTNATVPSSIDWRKKGYVTQVQDEDQCGSPYAFSALGALEGQHFKKTGKLIALSAQQLVDCSSSYGNNACCGGLMTASFQYIKENNGIDSNASYPYEGLDGTCRFKRSSVAATTKGYINIKAGNEYDLTNALANVGPVAVAMDASLTSFQFYKSGVYYDPKCSSTNLDHAALAVGYGKDSKGQEYYIVKNSWGVSWGDKGYILMAKNKNNNCGIASMSSYPMV